MDTINSLDGLLKSKPKPVQVVSTDVRQTQLTFENGVLPLFHCHSANESIQDWAKFNREKVNASFEQHRAILFRGFKLRSESDFTAFTQEFSEQLLDYKEPSTPRSKVGNKVYTSTEFPNDQRIPLHNEHAYTRHFPSKIWFYAKVIAEKGGQTPLADGRIIYRCIDSKIRRTFEEKGVMYVRNYLQGIDLPWQHVFDTEDQSVVESYCLKAGIACEWLDDGHLRTKQVAQGVIGHPETKEPVWFNQSHLFHVSRLDPELAEVMIDEYTSEGVPRNAFYGDGSPIPDEVIQHIDEVYEENSLVFDWQPADIVMLDNLTWAHGRRPYEGDRKVLVSMADAIDFDKIQNTDASLSDVRKTTARHFMEQMDAEESVEQLKYKLAVTYRMLAMEGLDEGVSGHITLRDPKNPDCFYVNPFGYLFEEVTPYNIIKVNKRGEVLEGEHPVNVTGFCIHEAIHDLRKDINCVVHTHAPWGTSFSSLDQELLPLDQNACMFFNNLAYFEEYNGPVNDGDDAKRLSEELGDKDAIILRNHGTITCGEDIEKATIFMLSLERACRLNVLAASVEKTHIIPSQTCEETKEWISNPIGLRMEYQAMMRKVERQFPELLSFKPQ